MSTPFRGSDERADLLERLALAGRLFSDSAVMFHAAMAEELGLGASEWKTLGLLDQHGPMTAGELSERSGLAPASVTGLLDRLEVGGWIDRDRDPEDRRRVRVGVNAAVTGSRFAASFSGLQRRLAKLYAGYSDEQLAFLCEAMLGLAACQREATAELQSAG